MSLSDITAIRATAGSMEMHNPGFMIVKPTLASLTVFRMMKNFEKAYPHEQRRLHGVLKQLRRRNFTVNTMFLNGVQFADGPPYVYKISSILPKEDDPCGSSNKTNCSVIVVHHTCVITKEAKIYRLREHIMWLYDGIDKYYSSKSRKYITFTNHKPVSLLNAKQLIKSQVSALKTALALSYILNRVLILPKFYCRKNNGGERLCPLNSLIRIQNFDSCFSGQYRESSFLRHPLVPDIVKESSKFQPVLSYSTRLSSASSKYTITSDNVVSVYNFLNESVLHCGTLENIIFIFSNDTIASKFQDRTRKAFKMSVYNQFTSGEFL